MTVGPSIGEEEDARAGGGRFGLARFSVAAATPLMLALGLAVLVSVMALADTPFLVLHTGLEMFCVVVGFSAFVVAWKARAFLNDNYLVLIGTAGFFTAMIDILHALTYKSMGIFPAEPPDVSTQFWITARTLETVGFLVAVTWPRRRFNLPLVLVAFGAVSLGAVWSILGWRVFPHCYDVVSGLTAFKTGWEFLLIALSLAGLGMLALHRDQFDRRVFIFLAGACLLRAGAEFLFSGYTDVFGVQNALGHVFKAAAFLCVLQGIVETALVRPLALIGRSLETERRLSVEVERQAATVRAVLDAAPDPYFVLDDVRRLSHVNPAAAALFPDEAVRRRLIGTFTADGPATGEIELADRRYDYRLAPLPGSGGAGATLAVLRDVTDRVTAERALRRALDETEAARAMAERANEAKSRFLAAASHDLRQPMQATRLFLEVLAHRLTDSTHLEVLNRAREALAGSDDLLKSLLDLSTLEAGIVSVDIRDIPIETLFSRLLDECAPMAAAKGLDLRVVSSGAVVRSDSVMLQRMLRNLLNNAIRYTDNGAVLLGCRRRGRHLMLCVIDTGRGIAEAERDLIFEEFYRVATVAGDRDGPGLGLGLSIVRRQARLLGHRLIVQSRPGRGSMFAVAVPLVDTPIASSSGRSRGRAEGVPAAGQPVLVIEDDPQQLTALTMVLDGWNLPARAAADAEAALAAVADGWRPALILCDLRLSGAVSGIELVGDLRTACGGAPIPAILLTGDTDPRRLIDASASGLALLHKPFTLDELLAAVRERLAPG